MAGYADRSDPGETALTNWIMAGLSAAGAIWLGWQLGWPWVFSYEDPDFNPVLIFEGVLLGLTVYFLVKGAVWQRRAQIYGATDLEVDGPVPVPLGGSFAGRLRFEQSVTPTGDWTLDLTCLDIHETRDTRDHANGPYRKDAYPVWTSRLTLPAEMDIHHGLPFRFDLPASVGPKPVPRLARKSAYFRFSASLNIPGLRRIGTHNAPPVGRAWTLVATAPAEGGGIRAEFTVPVDE